jgi:putative sigma-54 modulation protein
MEITVSGRHLAVSDELRTYVESKIGRLDRFDQAIERAEVKFIEERNPRISAKERCEVTMYGHGHIVRAHAAAFEQFASVDLVVEKLEHQLYKLKTRLKDRYRGRGHNPADIIRTVGAAEVVLPDGAAVPLAERSDGRAPVEPSPRVVKRKEFAMPAMTVDDAIIQLEMVGHGFYVFHNADSGELSVLYRRDDGDLGLIEREG